jgi:predicted TIM-barrel fold metal-dependent hydrolase
LLQSRTRLFGSNYPIIFPQAALAELDSLALDEEARELYLQGNTRRVFGLG